MSAVPPGLQPIADDLHAFGMAMSHEQWQDLAERIAEGHAPAMFRALLAVAELHQRSEPPSMVCTGCCDEDGDPEIWPCPTLCTISQTMTATEGATS